MDVLFIRYNKDYYITNGNLPLQILEFISLFNIKEIDKKVVLKNADVFTKNILLPIEEKKNLYRFNRLSGPKNKFKFIDNVKDYLKYGEKNEEFMLNSLFCFEDKFLNYIYIDVLDNIKTNKIIDHPNFYLNSIDIDFSQFEKKNLYIEDLIKNTDIGIVKNKEYFYNKEEFLDIYKIINRMLIIKED